MNPPAEIQNAEPGDAEDAAALFNEYRVWYGAAADLNGARNFVTQRLRQNQSTIFLARVSGQPAGFVQLYPSFSSVSMAEIWVLNDLFVAERHRGHGIGSLLLETAIEFARQTGAIRLQLETEVTNTAAQQVYERRGWQREDRFLHYTFELDDDGWDASISGANSSASSTVANDPADSSN